MVVVGETVMEGVISPFDHTFPVIAEDVKTIEPPEQMVVEPFALMVGGAGNGLIVTTIGAEVELQKPEVVKTLKVPL